MLTLNLHLVGKKTFKIDFALLVETKLWLGPFKNMCWHCTCAKSILWTLSIAYCDKNYLISKVWAWFINRTAIIYVIAVKFIFLLPSINTWDRLSVLSFLVHKSLISSANFHLILNNVYFCCILRTCLRHCIASLCFNYAFDVHSRLVLQVNINKITSEWT